MLKERGRGAATIVWHLGVGSKVNLDVWETLSAAAVSADLQGQ